MKHYVYNFLAALTLLITLSSAVAAQSRSDENTADATRTGTISGRVVNDSGQPLANAIVSVRTYSFGEQGRTTTTDSEGNFQVSGLDPVVYLISASFPTYVPAPRDPDINPIGYYRVGDSVRLELIKGGLITGTVTKSADEPAVAVPVRAYMVRDRNGQPSRYGAPFREQTTDDRGVYRIYGLPMGTYVVSAGGGGSSTGYIVNAYGTDAPTYAPASTRDAAMEVNVRTGEETANVDIRYRGEPGHAVSGIANSTVALDQPSGFSITLSSIFNGTSQSSYSAYQSPVGRGFSFNGVADGDYDVIAQSFLPGGEWTISEPRRIKVKGADITGIEVTTKPLGSITGHVVLEESKAPECKGKRRPLFGETLVTPWHNEKNAPKDQPQFLWGLGGPTLPDKQGEFALRNLAPGQYRFNARPMAKYWYLKSMSWPASVVTSARATPANRSVDAARNWTTLKPGDRLSGLTITIAEGAASLHGQINLAEGQKLPPKLFVYLVPAEREKADDVLRFFASLVSADGSFALANLPPGRYWAIAQAAGENESNVLSKLRLPDEAEPRARLLHDAEAAKIETELKPCQNVTDYRLPFRSTAPRQ
jgi:protocatechuate 3,4-dioxygenase beta subunit